MILRIYVSSGLGKRRDLVVRRHALTGGGCTIPDICLPSVLSIPHMTSRAVLNFTP